MSRISRAKPHTKRQPNPKKRRRSASSTEIQLKRWLRAKRYIPRILSAGDELFINLSNTILSLRVFTTTFATYNNQIFYTSRVSAFSFYLKKKAPAKEKQNRGIPPCTPANAAPQYIARGSQLVARHIRAQTRRSLNGCALVRLATQAVPSLLSISLSNTAARLLKPRL